VRRAVSVLEVAEPSLWAELAAAADIEPHLGEVIDARRRVVRPSFERELLPKLGDRVLVRYARRDAAEAEAEAKHLADEVARLRFEVRRVLFSAQRHALDEVVVGRQAWDPVEDAPAVRALHGAGLLVAVGDEGYEGRYRLHPDLPPPPEVPYDFAEAAMEAVDDLPDAGPGPVELLHDLAALAAALVLDPVRVTHAGTVGQGDARRLGRRLASAGLAASGKLEDDARWGRALRALKALGAVSVEPLSRELHLDLGLEATLAGETEDATDRLVHRLLERDLHVVVPAVRSALRAAGAGAVDEVIFLDLLRAQHRDVLFPWCWRGGQKVYGEGDLPYDDDAFDKIEAGMVRAALVRMVRMGLIRRGGGVFAATPDGRRWAGARSGPHPAMWVAGDLEMIVPPDALTPWERFQVERLGRCLQRDTVDRYKLDRDSLRAWLRTHEVDEAVALLRRRCPAVPSGAVAMLETWASSALRVVLTRGVLLDPAPPDQARSSV
jgi:hypothetical protein